MFTKQTTILTTLVLCFIGTKAAATSDYYIMIDPLAIEANAGQLVGFYSRLTPRERVTILTLDGQVLTQQIGLKKLPNGTIPGKEAGKLRQFQGALQRAAGNAVAQRRDNPLGCFRALAVACKGAPKVDRRVVIILGVSPLQQFPDGPDGPYGFQSDVYPGDGLLVEPSPYQVVRKDLSGVEIYWQLPASPDTGIVFDRAVLRFWTLHLQLRDARVEMVQGTVVDTMRIAQGAGEPPVRLDEALKRDELGMIRITTQARNPDPAPAPEPPPAPAPVAPAAPTHPIQILLRDHGGADGDRVAVTVDTVDLHQAMLLKGEAEPLRARVATGTHRVTVTALDQGSAGPTTVAVQVLDPDGAAIGEEHRFNLSVGEVAEFEFTLEAQD